MEVLLELEKIPSELEDDVAATEAVLGLVELP